MAEETGPDQVAADWQPLGGVLVGGVAVASWGTFESEVFAIHKDGQVWNRYWDGESWHGWKPMGGSFIGTPAAAARDAARIDVLAVGGNGIVAHRWWDGSTWVPWRELADAPRDAVAVACSWVGGELRIFVVDGERAVWCVSRR